MLGGHTHHGVSVMFHPTPYHYAGVPRACTHLNLCTLSLSSCQPGCPFSMWVCSSHWGSHVMHSKFLLSCFLIAWVGALPCATCAPLCDLVLCRACLPSCRWPHPTSPYFRLHLGEVLSPSCVHTIPPSQFLISFFRHSKWLWVIMVTRWPWCQLGALTSSLAL